MVLKPFHNSLACLLWWLKVCVNSQAGKVFKDKLSCQSAMMGQ